MTLDEERLNATVEAYGALSARTRRLQFAVHKLSKWSGVEIADLYEDDYLQEGDMD